MKNKFLLYITAVCLLMTTASCEDFLDQVNPNETLVENYWTNLNDCETGLVAVYNAFRNTNVMGLIDNQNRSDLSYPGYGRPNTNNEFYQQQFNSGSAGVNNLWDGNYKGIFYANQVIEGLEGVKDDYIDDKEQMEKWTTCMAQAKFFRGMFHFHLHSMFNQGNVIMFDFVPKDDTQYAQPLSAADDVKAFFREDLEYAYKNLPDSWENSEMGRVSKPAAGAILGKSYLYDKEYNKAAVYFMDVAKNYGYQLAHVSQNMTTKGEYNSESILEISYSLEFKPEESVYGMEGLSNNYNMVFSPNGGWRSNIPSLWLQIAMKDDPMDLNDPRNLYKDSNGAVRIRTHNLRASYTCAWVDDRELLYYGDTCHTAGKFNNKEAAYFRKNTNWDITDSEKTLLERSGVNLRVIRLTDIYLMLAECAIKGGEDPAGIPFALGMINHVRYRSALQLLGKKDEGSYLNSTYNEKEYTAQEVMDQLMYVERPIEFCCEGFCTRQIDMRRWGITAERFKDLATRPYWFDNYKYQILKDGKVKDMTKWTSVLKAGENPDTEKGETVYDFQQAAKNYNEDVHAYFPIPTSETDANKNLYKNIEKPVVEEPVVE